MGKRKPSTIIIEDNLIKVIANNTHNIFMFDNTEENYKKLNSYAWNEHDGYLTTKINRREELFAHHLIMPKKDGYKVVYINKNHYDCRSQNLKYEPVRKPSKIYREDGLIKIVANNTGNIFIFDDTEENYRKLNGYSWYESNNGYLQSTINHKNNYAHHLILPKRKGYDVDHINRNKKDNRSKNLRYVSRSQNAFNQNLRFNSTSHVTGVNWHKQNNKWRAYITINGKMLSLGCYNNINDAIKARKEAENKYFYNIKCV